MNRPNVQPGETDDPVFSLKASIVFFLGTCYLSLLPATTTGYIFIALVDPWALLAKTGAWWLPAAVYLTAVVASMLVLYAWSWLQAVLSVSLVMGFKGIPEGKFKKSIYDADFQRFCKRHLVKKFSMWLFKFHSPRFVYRKYAGSFIKLGKHVEVPEWFPMEMCEFGDNTSIARQIVIGSHVVEGDAVTVKAVKIGKNCIIDTGDEMHRSCIGPGCVIEDNVIIKAGTSIIKDVVLKSGGIYEGDLVINRVGEVADLSGREIDSWRESVLAKSRLQSRMLRDWSSFTSRTPRVQDKVASLVGYSVAVAAIVAWWLFVLPWIDRACPFIGLVINLAILPAVTFVAYGLNVFIPLGVLYPVIKRYRASIPGHSQTAMHDGPGGTSIEGNAVVEITDATLIDRWKRYKWLKWRMVERICNSLFPDVSALLYRYIGAGNDVALKSTFSEAVVDTDFVSIGENSLLSVGSHLYAYSLVDGPNPRLVVKRTSIGKNCVIAPSIIHAGARVGDNVMVGIHSLVPADTILEGNQLYAGNPVTDWKSFVARRKQAKEALASKA